MPFGCLGREVTRRSCKDTPKSLYAKQQLQTQPSESKLLGLKWDKAKDTLAVQFPTSTSRLVGRLFVPKPTIHAWLDSTVALHWILGNGQYRQFVENRLQKIRAHSQIQWRHVPTADNPADLASRGGQVTDSVFWWNGPEWLQDSNR